MGKDVTVRIDGELFIFKGPMGEVKKRLPAAISIEEKELDAGAKGVFVSLKKDVRGLKNSSAILGTGASLVRGAVLGVTKGYEKKLMIEGVGFKAALDGADLTLSLGFTHPVKIKAEGGVTFKVEKNSILVSGADKEMVGLLAARIRSKKPVEPYKGKGIFYQGEVIRRKAGKKAVATA